MILQRQVRSRFCSQTTLFLMYDAAQAFGLMIRQQQHGYLDTGCTRLQEVILAADPPTVSDCCRLRRVEV